MVPRRKTRRVSTGNIPDRLPAQRYSILTPDALTTALQRASSFARNAPNSIGPSERAEIAELLNDVGRLDDLVDRNSETIDPHFRRRGGDDGRYVEDTQSRKGTRRSGCVGRDGHYGTFLLRYAAWVD
jgi:hypothetical protein